LPLIAAQPPANAVWLIYIGINPEVITVKVGTAVTWTDFDSLPYTVMSDDGLFLSPELAEGSSWSFTFTQPGSYSYHVSEDMNGLVGKVIVE
jgi:plastocyanin